MRSRAGMLGVRKRVLDKCAADGKSGKQLRVLYQFFEPETPMDALCLEYINGSPMAAQINELLEKYENIVFDEIHAEGIHRDASQLLTHGAGLETVSLSSKLRLKQNLAKYDVLSPEQQAKLHARFHSPLFLAKVSEQAYRSSPFNRIRT